MPPPVAMSERSVCVNYFFALVALTVAHLCNIGGSDTVSGFYYLNWI